jgi:hypothetical protein
MENDSEYYRRRMCEEQQAARKAANPDARERHEELAAAYELRCRLLHEQLRTIQQQRLHEALESLSF